MARILVELCIAFGVPRKINCGEGNEFKAEVVIHLSKWLKVDIAFWPSDHPWGRGAVGRLRGWLLDILAESCRS